jgi:hypothetical protein
VAPCTIHFQHGRVESVEGMDELDLSCAVGDLDRLKSKQAGFDRHLVKPIGRATLEELVQSATEDR